jgi:RNA polymerase sigma-70 factor, ECF subfamily
LTSLEEAVGRVLQGDASAFQQVVDATSTQLVRLGARMLGNVADAEDVVQEAYVKAYRSLLAGQFDGRARVDTWLYRIVVNGAIDAKRKRKRSVESVASVASNASSEPRAPGKASRGIDEMIDPGWEGATSAEARLALNELVDWLSDLPPDQHAVLVLKAVEGKSSAEVAEILGISEGAVEQRLVRARATLRKRRDES